MTSPGKELLENSEQREALGLGGRGYSWRQPSSQPSFVCLSSPPLRTPPGFSSPAPGSVHCPLRPPAPPHSMKPCPLHSLHTAGPRGTGTEPPTHTHACAGTHIHTHGGHNTSTQGCGSSTPEGSVLSLAFRAQPAPETAWARPGPSTSASPLLGLSPLQAPPQRKRGTVPTWRASGGICPSAHLALVTSPTSLVSASQEGKGAKQENGSHSPSPRTGLAEEGAGSS